ncbi:hypothetical protein [Vibrio owensii]|uniref:hypothetical protein n=1 Tax=Vibrio harveyi group TaxID=717610 RepID=UPI003CC5152E
MIRNILCALGLIKPKREKTMLELFYACRRPIMKELNHLMQGNTLTISCTKKIYEFTTAVDNEISLQLILQNVNEYELSAKYQLSYERDDYLYLQEYAGVRLSSKDSIIFDLENHLNQFCPNTDLKESMISIREFVNSTYGLYTDSMFTSEQ